MEGEGSTPYKDPYLEHGGKMSHDWTLNVSQDLYIDMCG